MLTLPLMPAMSLLSIFLSVCLCYVLYYLGVGFYNITFHPLAKIPGPKLRGAFHFPTVWDLWSGKSAHNRKALHDRYGNTVRSSPSFVSFNNAEAWQEIYGYRLGKKQIPKDFRGDKDGVADIISANDVDHARIRRLLNHAFSEAALREQEPLVKTYFDLLIQKLYEQIDGPTNGKINIVRWFNFTTFDLIGDLCFGEGFDALKNEEYNFWIANIFKFIKFFRVIAIVRAIPLIGPSIISIMTLFPGLESAKVKHDQYTRDKSIRRLDKDTDRRDFISYILRHNDEKGMSREEIIKTSGTLIVAGSETSATLLSGVMFHLLKNPSTIAKLTSEIRTTFTDPAEMTFVKLAKLQYLNACLQEALRIYPPVPGIIPRKMVPGGAVINGYFIPEGVSCGVHQLGAYHHKDNFLHPDSYIPERWLGDSRFASDKRGVWQPFSFGPRNCVGQSLAMAEMRSILARVLWHFDFSLCEESKNWDDQKVFVLWEKPDLWVRLRARK